MVDDAIVMIENIARYIERGDDPRDASLRGSRQIAFTVVSLTVSLIAVLIPLLFMSDVVGRLFSEFAVTLSVTILISAVVSLTLVPMMCALLLRQRATHAAPTAAHPHPEAEARQNEVMGAGWFGRLIGVYDRCLVVVFRHQPLTLLIAVGTVVLTVLLYSRSRRLLRAGYGGSGRTRRRSDHLEAAKRQNAMEAAPRGPGTSRV